MTVTVPADFKGDTLDVKLYAEWLVCKDICIPQSGDFVLKLPAQAATAGNAALFATARAAQPQPVADAKASAKVEDGALVVRVAGLPAAWQGKTLAFFPETAGVIQNAAAATVAWSGAEWTARVPLDPQRSEAPKLIPAVLTTPGEAAGLQVQVAVDGAWPAATAAAATAPALCPTCPEVARIDPPRTSLSLAHSSINS